MMKYKGYIGRVTFDDEQHIFTGEIVNTRDVITFQGSSVQELEAEFRNSVEDYLAWCKQDGVAPEKPYSGKFAVRVSPATHEQAVVAARRQGTSLNHFVEMSIEHELRRQT
ncbi:MAG: type II toxin-antitoxin system HicB family antitoxin [Oscillospiraceae bacterium]|nr:type II toxin-antitoxin system HicB family antitoxin [Oscillospiraceae bacterium]